MQKLFILTAVLLTAVSAVFLPAQEAPAPHNSPAVSSALAESAERLPPHYRGYFEKLRQEDPKEFERLLKLRVSNRKEFLGEMKSRISDPNREFNGKLGALDRQCWEVAAKLRAVPPPENAAELEQELDALIAQSMEQVLAHTQARLNQLQKRLQLIQENREKIQKERRAFFMTAPLPSPCDDPPAP